MPYPAMLTDHVWRPVDDVVRQRTGFRLYAVTWHADPSYTRFHFIIHQHATASRTIHVRKAFLDCGDVAGWAYVAYVLGS